MPRGKIWVIYSRSSPLATLGGLNLEFTWQSRLRSETHAASHAPRSLPANAFLAGHRDREAERLLNEALHAAEGRTRRTPPERQELLRATTTCQNGALRLRRDLPLAEGKEVEVEIRRKT